MKFTILGSQGFIGRSLKNELELAGHECFCPELREENVSNIELGHVIYAIGVPNFLQRPNDAIDAHVCKLNEILQTKKFESLLYLSGTRVYYNSKSTNEEEPIIVNSLEQNELYNISKLMGESLCISQNNPKIKIVRLSNVSGNNFSSDLFLPSIILDALKNGKIIIRSSLESQKDYIHINDVTKILPEIMLHGKYNIYNVAYGTNTKTGDILKKIKSVTNCKVDVLSDSPEYSFPRIFINRLQDEFDFHPASILDKIEEMIIESKKFLESH